MECMSKMTMDMQGRYIDSQGRFVDPSRVPDGQGRYSLTKRNVGPEGRVSDMPNNAMEMGGPYMDGQGRPFDLYMDRGYMRHMEPMSMRYMDPGRFGMPMENNERYMDLSRFTMDFEGRYMDPSGRFFDPFSGRGAGRMMDIMRPQMPRNGMGGE